jgi:hypothetical protein
MKLTILVLSLFILADRQVLAQNIDVKPIMTEGYINVGYVDNGAFVNFMGPGLKYKNTSSELVIGVLPSLRFKNDSGNTKNSFVTPSLGLGLTYTFKSYTFQLPLYYNSKTATKDGRWNMGIGLGIKINHLFKKL